MLRLLLSENSMRQITVSCVAFVYGCVRGPAPHSVLIKAISDFLVGEKLLIIFNDSPLRRVDTIVNDLDLSGSKNVCICSGGGGLWKFYDANTNSLPIVSRSSCLGDALENIQRYYGLSEASTLTVGVSSNHFLLEEHSALHFHVGPEESLTHRVRGLIPLTDQYEFGLSNILTHFTQEHYSDTAFECQDLVNYVGSSRDFFRSNDAAWILAEKHVRASRQLANAFPEDIVAIFGTGFPFYMPEDCLVGIEVETPGSILNYFDVQFNYFRSKLIDEGLYLEHYTTVADVEEMSAAFGLNVLRNEFDNYKYEQMNCAAPAEVENHQER